MAALARVVNVNTFSGTDGALFSLAGYQVGAMQRTSEPPVAKGVFTDVTSALIVSAITWLNLHPRAPLHRYQGGRLHYIHHNIQHLAFIHPTPCELR